VIDVSVKLGAGFRIWSATRLAGGSRQLEAKVLDDKFTMEWSLATYLGVR
jgi:hypothetical protein